jgi:hypothetical protein
VVLANLEVADQLGGLSSCATNGGEQGNRRKKGNPKVISSFEICENHRRTTAQGTRTLHVGAGTGNLPRTVTISLDGTSVWKA